MTSSRCGVLLGILLVGALPLLADGDEGGWGYDGNLAFRSADGRFELDIINRVQARFTADDPDIGESGQSFDLERYRLTFAGKAFEHWEFLLQSDLATGSLSDDETNSELLLDACVKFAKRRLAQLWIGQGKVAFGRQALIDSGRLQFVDRSIATERFAHGRDVGVALVGENENRTYAYSVGFYNGNGINQGADENKDYLAAARLVVTPLGAFEMMESDPGWTTRPEPRLAVGVALMTNNTGEGSFEEERVNTGALEFAFRVRGFSLAGEFFTESRDALTSLPGDEADTDGWYAQTGYAFPVTELGMFELAARYSEILRDVADADETEAGIALGFYFRGHGGKIQADYRALDFEGIPFGDNIDTHEGRIQFQLIF
jgi:phosphate-selective porin OprO/OprP